jgi:hypothetical protein
MPAVPAPEDCDLEETHYLRRLESEKLPTRLKHIYQDIVSVSAPAFSARFTNIRVEGTLTESHCH